ncbi:MAG: hypothetical protein LBS21_11735 [Clostridiales bacterium]|jgi:hypothetical protein|nr:hypothetical protein [Clostridiales bacterium]
MNYVHIELLSELIDRYKEKAEALTAPDADFSDVCYFGILNEENISYDKNQTERLRILTGIQFIENIAPFEDLIRFLLTEEIEARERDSFQGFGIALKLAVWLIKKFYREKDEELFAKAKNANFDTYCGFNAKDIGESFFKKDIAQFDMDESIILTLYLREYILCGKLIELWKGEQTEWNVKNLNRLISYERGRKNSEGELSALNMLFELESDNMSDWDYCSLSNDIASKQIELHQIQSAFETARRMMPKLAKVDNWQSYGLGRSIMEMCMDIVILCDKFSATQIWNFTKPHLSKMKEMPWNLYEKAAKAADIMSEPRLSKSLRRRLEKEKQKLRAFRLSKFRRGRKG